MTVTERLRTIEASDLAMLGIQDLAYVKPLMVDGKKGFAIHAADGTQLAIAASEAQACGIIRQNDLEPVSVH
jgi:hypothetical protein